MKSILMATDLSARSDRALERAVDLAGRHDAELTIVHVVDEDLPPTLADAQQMAAGQAIQEHVDTLTTDDGPHIRIEAVFGRAYIGVLEVSEEVDVDLDGAAVWRRIQRAMKELARIVSEGSLN